MAGRVRGLCLEPYRVSSTTVSAAAATAVLDQLRHRLAEVPDAATPPSR